MDEFQLAVFVIADSARHPVDQQSNFRHQRNGASRGAVTHHNGTLDAVLPLISEAVFDHRLRHGSPSQFLLKFHAILSK